MHRRAPLAKGKARCVACGATLYRGGPGATVAALLAVAITAVVGFLLAASAPLVTVNAKSHMLRVSLWDAATVAQDRGLTLVAIVLGVTLVIAPMFELLLLLWVLVPLAAGHRPPAFVAAMQMLHQLRPWRMIEVFVLGVAVAIVKLGTLAPVTPGWGVLGIGIMTLALAAIGSFDRDALWRRADEVVA